MSSVIKHRKHTVEDDSLNGSVYTSRPIKVDYVEIKPQLNLRDSLIDFVIKHPKTTKGDLLINVSSSGTANGVISALIRAGIFIEVQFDCNHCTYLTVDKSKVKLV